MPRSLGLLMRRLRVLCFHDAYYDYVGAFVNGLADHADVMLVHPADSDEYLRDIVRDDVRAISVPLPRRRNPRRLLASPRLEATARRLGADIVHVQQSGDPWFNLRQVGPFRVPRVDTIHDVRPHPGDRTTLPGGGLTHRLSRRSIDRYITHAPALAQDLAAAWRLPSDRIDVVPMGELGSLYGGRLPGCEPVEPPRVLFFGRVWPYKGLDRLILAMNELAPRHAGLTLVIAGEGEPLDRYLALVAPGLTLDVRNRRVGLEETREVFSDATVACLPYVEASQSAALTMAYGFGVPVVATAVGGLPYAVRDGVDGLLVAPDDVPALAAAISRVLDDAALRARLRQGVAERLAGDLNWSTIGAQTVEVYRRAIAAASAG